VVGGPLYLGTAGLGLSLGTGTDKDYRVAAGFAGGAAFLTITGELGTFTKTVPYLELGTSIAVPLGTHLTMGGDLRFLAAFDQELVIMGISPGITIGMEF
jgi:hypothetical protein